MTPFVCDACAVVQKTLGTVVGNAMFEAIDLSSAVYYAPDIYAYEVPNSFWKYVRNHELTEKQALGLATHALDLIECYSPAGDYYDEAFHLAVRHTHSFYDMCYVVLAKHLHATFITCDRELARIAQAEGVNVLNGLKLVG